jgi:hypothetical protein
VRYARGLAAACRTGAAQNGRSAGPLARVGGRRHPAPDRGVRRRLRHDRPGARRAGTVGRRVGAPLSRGFPRLGRTGPGVAEYVIRFNHWYRNLAVSDSKAYNCFRRRHEI